MALDCKAALVEFVSRFSALLSSRNVKHLALGIGLLCSNNLRDRNGILPCPFLPRF